MASPHPGYPGHGPGPSSYYHPSPPPPPPHLYGAHSPGPAGPAPYSYPPPHQPYPPPPPHHAQPVPHHSHLGHPHHPGPSRGRGGAPYGSRNQPPYPYYPPPPPQYGHHLHGPSPQPTFVAGKNPQAPAFSPSPVPFYPNPAALPFTPPPRHTPVPKPVVMSQSSSSSPSLAPAPAQLPQPNMIANGYSVYETRHIVHPLPEKPPMPIPFEPPAVVEQPPPPPPPEEEPHPEERTPTPPPHTSYESMGTIQTNDNAVPGSPHSASSSPTSPSSKQSPNPIVHWAIWSRRPHNPSSAPGIIISPHARPPANIVEQAIDAKTPPPSPGVVPKRLPGRSIKVLPATSVGVGIGVGVVEETASSSTVTATDAGSTVPHSPISSRTSVDGGVPVAVAKDEVEVKEETKEAEEVKEDEPSKKDEDPVEVHIAPVEGKPAEPEPEPVAVVAPESTDAPPAAAPIAPAPAAPPVKRSWASLLKPQGEASTTPAKNSLPTSSVVGFSIPASALAASSSSSGSGAPSSAAAASVPASRKAELIQLLSSAAPSGAATAAGAAQRIKPKGLVNSGNMCFANSVLQILVYCPPFSKLFTELGKHLPLAGGSGENPKPGVASGSSGSAAASSSITPLVDATIQFLKEFVAEKRRVNGVNGVNGGYGGKGKEKEVRLFDHESEEDDWDMDSFLPSYVYDAMKEKKRFDSMRGGQQEDAEEFLGFYLDSLEEELLHLLNTINPPPPPPSSTGKPSGEEEVEATGTPDGWMEVGKKNRTMVTRASKTTESPITRIFGGKFRSILRAPRQKDSVVLEEWRSLRLDIQRDQIKTIQDALSYISHPQPVQLTLSTLPGVPVEASQQVLIESLPPVLVLHIKRFCYDTTVKGVVKVGKQVTFGPEVEIPPDLMSPTVRKATGTRYKLFGVLYHHGLSASGGHYTLDVLHPNRFSSPASSSTPNSSSSAWQSKTSAKAAQATPAAAAAAAQPKTREGWIRIDDELVSDVRPEDVFGNQEKEDVSGRCAYLLFYRRVSW